eukprot:4510742-Prymnesium_polylepis.1
MAFRTWVSFGMCAAPCTFKPSRNMALGRGHYTRQWASLSQKDPALWAPCCGGGATFVEPAERDEAQVQAADAYEARSSRGGFPAQIHSANPL